jgi:hypothetical protein
LLVKVSDKIGTATIRHVGDLSCKVAKAAKKTQNVKGAEVFGVKGKETGCPDSCLNAVVPVHDGCFPAAEEARQRAVLRNDLSLY